ncbi:MAG: divalent-cation tolerance protein CutA [Terriglobales bacterium]
MIFILVACSTQAEAEAIGQALLEQKLVACASIGPPIQSSYWWQGKLEQAREVPLTLKTLPEHFAAVEAEVRRLHSYETPEIVAVAACACSSAYAAWLGEAVEHPVARP